MTTRLLLHTPLSTTTKRTIRCSYQHQITSAYYTATLLKHQQQQHSYSNLLPSLTVTPLSSSRTSGFLLKIPRRNHGSHSHDHHIHADIATTFEQSGKKGVQITMIGLASNVGLTLTKGAAGWFMNSAALLADAAHSLGDLLSDFVTLYTFKMSRKMPDHKYPYGYGKFETMGSLAISSLLIAGAIGIGAHSFELLQATLNNASTIHVTQAIQETAPMMMTEAAQHQAVEKAATTTPASFAAIPSMLHDHGSHSHSLTSSDGTLNPNAAWFALASVLVKEWLYRATLKVGRSERSEVLIANAWHHRSDALSSGVAMVAIGGSYAGITVLDPLGGLVVAGMILKSTFGIAKSSLRELTDRGMESSEADKIRRIMAQMKNIEPNLIDFHSIRGRKLGPFYHVDMALKVNPELSVQEARRLEHRVRSAIQRDCEQVQQILVRLETPLSL